MVEEIKVHFLGTADSVPSESRNHPAFLLSYGGENVLVDCGEGTQRQFRKAKLNPCKVNRILITHWHADHVLGLPGFLQTLSMSGYSQELVIYGPEGSKKKFDHLMRLFGFPNEISVKYEEVSGKFFETDDYYFEAKEMEHGIPTNAYSFVVKDRSNIDKSKLEESGLKAGPHLQKLKEGKDVSVGGKKYRSKDLVYVEKGKKVSFVLDTKYNQKIKSLVKGSDLWISECTYGSELKDLAKDHLHLSADQVGKIAESSGVKTLALVHISQRYQKNLKKVLDEVKEYHSETYLPKDLDSFKV
ncbi:MAG: ribonuclease Z [Candidatus Pacearchaeota archaeon]